MAAMTKRRALTEARQMLGKDAAIQHQKAGPFQSDRDAANRALVELRATKPARSQDAEAWAVWKAEHSATENQLMSLALSYRCTVGCVIHSRIGSYYRICGQGDTWEQALDKARRHA